MTEEQGMGWENVFRHYHFNCNRSDPLFRASLHDLPRADRIALYKFLGWEYVEEQWLEGINIIHNRVKRECPDYGSFPATHEEGKPIVESFWENENFKNLYPPMDEETYERTRASVRKHGFENPVIVNPFGLIYDGHHRFRMWKELKEEGIEIILPYEVRHFQTDEEILDFLKIQNEYRRHLDLTELAKRGVEMLPGIKKDIEQERRQKQVATRTGRKRVETGPPERATQRAGKILGISPSTIERMKVIEESRYQDIKAAVESKTMSVNAGWKEVRKRDRKNEESGDDEKAAIQTREMADTGALESEASSDQLSSWADHVNDISTDVDNIESTLTATTIIPGSKPKSEAQIDCYLKDMKTAREIVLEVMAERYGSCKEAEIGMNRWERKILDRLNQAIIGENCKEAA